MHVPIAYIDDIQLSVVHILRKDTLCIETEQLSIVLTDTQVKPLEELRSCHRSSCESTNDEMRSVLCVMQWLQSSAV